MNNASEETRFAPTTRGALQRALLPSRIRVTWICAALVLGGSRSFALNLEQCVSADGHVYVIATTSTTGIGTLVTSLAMARGGTGACVTGGSRSDGVMTFAASDGPLLAGRLRTTVLSGFFTNALTCAGNFDPDGAGGSGVLHLPGPAERTVSTDPTASSEALVPVTEADSAVPAAVDKHLIASGKHRHCRGSAMTFPTGPATADGFLLQGNCSNPATCQIVVFVGDLGADACSVDSSASIAGVAMDGGLNAGGPEAALRASAAGCGSAATTEYSPPEVALRPEMRLLRDVPVRQPASVGAR